MTEEKILARVRKMLALANDEAATEGERDTALNMAQNLLVKHQLSMEDVAQFDKDKLDPRGEFSTDGWNLPWCRDVRSAVAKLFMCSYFYRKINTTKGHHTFLGRESNATTAMYMSEYIIKSLLRECDKRYGHRLTPGGRSFGVGAALRLHGRVREMQQQSQREVTATGSALVLVDLAAQEKSANEEMMYALHPKMRVAKARDLKVDYSAYAAGREHANSIGLNTQVGNKKGTLAIK